MDLLRGGRHSQSIVHAHLHLIPFNFNKEIEKELIDSLKLETFNDYNQIKEYASHDYWFYCNPTGKCFSSVDVLDAPKSIFMNLIAKQVGIPTPYEWRTAGTKKEYINEMKKIFNEGDNL